VTPASWSLIATVDTRHTALGPDTSSGLLVAHHFDDREVGSSWPITSTIARYLRLCHEMFQIPAARN
jgi:hypothetical protein